MFEKHFELNEDTIPIAEDKQQSRWYVTMKKRLVLIINASLMLVILAFVAFFQIRKTANTICGRWKPSRALRRPRSA